MALDKLVDSSKLDACCTAEANAIRAKTGSSAQIAYDWANSKGFADAIAAISGGGLNLSALAYPVTLQNNRTGNITVIRILYDNTAMLGGLSAVVAGNGTTATYSDMLTDGTHIWFRFSNLTVISYNGSPASYASGSNSFIMLTIPAGFDGSIPFIIT